MKCLFLLAAIAVPLAAHTASVSTADAREVRTQEATLQRLTHATSSRYDPYETKSQERYAAAVKQLEKKRFTRAVEEAEAGIKLCPLNIDLLMILSAAHRAAGDAAKADACRTQWMSLIDSILASGDGRDFATAFRVIDVHEEYAVLRAMQLRPVGQKLLRHEGSTYDVIEVINRAGEGSFAMYFNVDLPTTWLSRRLTASR